MQASGRKLFRNWKKYGCKNRLVMENELVQGNHCCWGLCMHLQRVQIPSLWMGFSNISKNAREFFFLMVTSSFSSWFHLISLVFGSFHCPVLVTVLQTMLTQTLKTISHPWADNSFLQKGPSISLAVLALVQLFQLNFYPKELNKVVSQI